ncbi:hypothetical protein Tco_0803954 [Tanacetum coccineum]|uniref:Uncharacterized protein n=1 Tax=Tanacetum coccineum TaxID=301880 RepID=A0ABQ5A5J0_9ASTR
MKDNPQLQQEDLPIWLALKYKFERLHMATTPCRPFAVRPRDQDDPHDDAHPEGENSAKRQNTSDHGTFVFGESSFGQDYESEPGPSTSGNQDQSNDFDFWTNSYATDDVLLDEKVSQELVDEMSQTVDEAKKEIIVPPYQPKPTPVVQSFQRDPKAPALSLVNQDLLYLKKGNIRPEKIALSLHKFPTVRFPDNDIEERTSRWIFYTRKQQEPGKPKEEVYSNSKIVQIIKTYWELGHEHKFITEIVARRANGCIVSIIESDYKNLNKNDIEDMSTVIWERVYDFQLGVESYQQQVNLIAPTTTFPGIKKCNVFFIVSELVYGIIYKNMKKEKRVMRHQEVHKFCDATLKRVFEGLKSYNNDVKYGYVTHNLSKEDVEYLQLFAEEVEERLKYRDQMRK